MRDLRRRGGAVVIAIAVLGCGEARLEVGATAPAREVEADADGAFAPAPAPAPDGGEAAGDAAPPRPEAPFVPGEPVMPRLTATQYRNTLTDVFGEDLPRTPVEPDTNPYLFYSIGAATTEVSETGVEQYAEAAFLVAEAVFADPARRARVLTCEPADEACLDAYVRGLGRRLFRRPLGEDEVAQWLAVARDTAGDDPLVGAESVLAGMLQSPAFLYRAEVGEPAGATNRYTSWEMAARLAFLLTDAAPDDALLDAAARGELLDDASLEAHARRLLETPRAREAVQAFFAQYFDLGGLRDVDLDPAQYPGFSPGLLRAMETEVRLLVDDVVFRRGGDVRTLFSAPRAYVNRDLAALYGVDAPGATATAFVPVEFGPETPRAGLLTLGAFLTMNAHRTETSPTLRGKFVRERVLCQEVPPPPPDVDLNLERRADSPPTLRERLEEHRSNPTCAGCHAFIDPPGFLFEHYDSMGRYRETAEGHPIDSSGDLDGLPLTDALDLADVIADDDRVGKCIARQLFRYASGRLEARAERPALKALERAFAESGYDFRALLVALVLSDAFRLVAPVSGEAPQ